MNTGCLIFKTHGGWVRVGECGLVFEVVALLSHGVVLNDGVVGNNGVEWRRICNIHEDWPGSGRRAASGSGRRAVGGRAADGVRPVARGHGRS